MKVVGVRVKKAEEPWAEYALEDGSVLRLKVVLVDIRRAENNWDETGNPIYQFKHAVVVDLQAPEKLKKKR